MAQVQRRVLSTPAPVFWAGWESTTTRLQQSGWEIAVDEDVVNCRIRLAMRHQGMQLHAITAATDFDYFHGQHRAFQLRPFHVTHVARRLEVVRMCEPVDFAKFSTVDAYPQVIETELKTIDDYKIFAVPLARTQELIVEPDQVGRLLEMIREVQAPEQAAIRGRQRRQDESEPAQRQKFHAQILSLVA